MATQFAALPVVDVLRNRRLTDGDKVLYAELALRAGAKGFAWPSLTELQGDTGKARSTLVRSLRRLLDERLIRRAEWGGMEVYVVDEELFNRFKHLDLEAINRLINRGGSKMLPIGSTMLPADGETRAKPGSKMLPPSKIDKYIKHSHTDSEVALEEEERVHPDPQASVVCVGVFKCVDPRQVLDALPEYSPEVLQVRMDAINRQLKKGRASVRNPIAYLVSSFSRGWVEN